MRGTLKESGFSLVEALVATTVLAAVLGGLAHVMVLSSSAGQRARASTLATLLAAAKMEELRAVIAAPDGFWNDIAGAASPAGALDNNTQGYCDFFDARGRRLPSEGSPPDAAVLTRRWSLQPLATAPDRAMLIQVLVMPASSGMGGAGGGLPAGSVRLVDLGVRRGF